MINMAKISSFLLNFLVSDNINIRGCQYWTPNLFQSGPMFANLIRQFVEISIMSSYYTFLPLLQI